MAIKVGINGFGRIGRNIYRAAYELKPGFEIVAVNDIGDSKTFAHLLKHDTALGTFAADVSADGDAIKVDGRLSSFADLTLGMDLEATGVQNIVFRCVFMGLTFEEANRLSPSIQEFSELGDFLQLPVRTYSTGMFLRLAFAISTSIEPDIIVMDEMIGAGDARFIAKAQARLSDLLRRVKILVLATHDESIMESLCSKIVWLDHGEIREVGSFSDIYPKYLAATA